MRFTHLPVASELFTNIQDNAWYANAFVTAHYNGLDIPKDVNPGAVLTREKFAYLLDKAFEHQAKLPMITLKTRRCNATRIYVPSRYANIGGYQSYLSEITRK